MVVTPGTSWGFQDVIKVKEDAKSSFTPADVIPWAPTSKEPLKLREYQKFHLSLYEVREESFYEKFAAL